MTPDQAMPPTQRELGRADPGPDRLRLLALREHRASDRCSSPPSRWAWRGWLFLAVLALVHRFREDKRRRPTLDPATGPLVSVLIPCFNEEKVIASSVARILESNWTQLEVLVLDDGSTDDTAAEVERGVRRRPARAADALRQRRQGPGPQQGPGPGPGRDRRGAGRRHPVPARHHRPAGALVRRPQGRRGGRQRPGRQPPATWSPAGRRWNMSPPRTWSGGRWRRWARSPWCPARWAPGGARRWRRWAAIRPTPWPRTRT